MAMIVVFQIPLRIFKILKTQRRISFGHSNAHLQQLKSQANKALSPANNFLQNVIQHNQRIRNTIPPPKRNSSRGEKLSSVSHGEKGESVKPYNFLTK